MSHPLPSARQSDALADELRDQNGSRRSRTLAPKGPPGFKAGLALREFTIQRIRVRGLAPPASRSRTACSTIELHPEEDGSRRTRTAAGCPANLFSRQVSSPGRVHDPRIPAEGIAPSCRPHEGRFVLDERRCGLEAYGGSRTRAASIPRRCSATELRRRVLRDRRTIRRRSFASARIISSCVLTFNFMGPLP